MPGVLMEEKLPMAFLYSSALEALHLFGRLGLRPRIVPPQISERRLELSPPHPEIFTA